MIEGEQECWTALQHRDGMVSVVSGQPCAAAID